MKDLRNAIQEVEDLIEEVLELLSVDVNLNNYDLSVKENFGERKEVIELRRAAEEGCGGGTDDVFASLYGNI